MATRGSPHDASSGRSGGAPSARAQARAEQADRQQGQRSRLGNVAVGRRFDRYHIEVGIEPQVLQFATGDPAVVSETDFEVLRTAQLATPALRVQTLSSHSTVKPAR